MPRKAAAPAPTPVDLLLEHNPDLVSRIDRTMHPYDPVPIEKFRFLVRHGAYAFDAWTDGTRIYLSVDMVALASGPQRAAWRNIAMELARRP